jgi:hypothetical protein
VRIIGAANEFWRLRITRVDTTDGLDFEWHEDILYRTPSINSTDEVELWYVEAIRLDDYEAVVALATFTQRYEADDFLRQAQEDLLSMTKAQFEEAYLNPSPRVDEHGESDCDLFE